MRPPSRRTASDHQNCFEVCLLISINDSRRADWSRLTSLLPGKRCLAAVKNRA
jgi:hypothetical protein